MITDYRKQSELILTSQMDERINVIGCGALGSWVALFLLKMGFKNVHVYDYDVVEEHNLPNQMFKEYDIGTSKVEATKFLYMEMFNEKDTNYDRLKIHNVKVTKENAIALGGYTISCVDSMTARKELYEAMFLYGKSSLWIEGRIGLYGAYIYTLIDKTDIDTNKKYEGTLYEDTEAEVSACGVSQTALPAAVNCASVMIMQLIEHICGRSVHWKLEYTIPDLVAMVE